MNDSNTIETIAAELTAALADADPFVNHFEVFETIAAEHGCDVDYERQDSEDPGAAFEIFVEGYEGSIWLDERSKCWRA